MDRVSKILRLDAKYGQLLASAFDGIGAARCYSFKMRLGSISLENVLLCTVQSQPVSEVQRCFFVPIISGPFT
jgi:hypothetical protein